MPRAAAGSLRSGPNARTVREGAVFGAVFE